MNAGNHYSPLTASIAVHQRLTAFFRIKCREQLAKLDKSASLDHYGGKRAGRRRFHLDHIPESAYDEQAVALGGVLSSLGKPGTSGVQVNEAEAGCQDLCGRGLPGNSPRVASDPKRAAGGRRAPGEPHRKAGVIQRQVLEAGSANVRDDPFKPAVEWLPIFHSASLIQRNESSLARATWRWHEHPSGSSRSAPYRPRHRGGLPRPQVLGNGNDEEQGGADDIREA